MTSGLEPSHEEIVGDLAQALHDAAHPTETHRHAGLIYRTMAERLWIELSDGGGALYEWLADRNKP